MINQTVVDQLAGSLSALPPDLQADAVATWNSIGRAVAHRLHQRQAEAAPLDDRAAAAELYPDEPMERALFRVVTARPFPVA